MLDPEADKFGIADVFLDNIFSAVPETAVPRLPYSH
jgi:hypothetical protein